MYSKVTSTVVVVLASALLAAPAAQADPPQLRLQEPTSGPLRSEPSGAPGFSWSAMGVGLAAGLGLAALGATAVVTARGRGRKRVLVAGVLLALAATTAGPVSAASDRASCVGAFSSYFAHGGGGTHRSDVAREFAHEARPAGRNVYSHVADFHGDVGACFEQT
jgi:hypothetical protein